MYTGLDGPYLAVNKTARAPIKDLEPVFDEILNVEGSPIVKKSMKWRFFGVNPPKDKKKREMILKWMSSTQNHLEDKANVLQPIIAVMRKLYFQTETYTKKGVLARGKRIKIDWTSDDTFSKSMDDIIKIYLEKKQQYKENRTKKKSEAKDRKKEVGIVYDIFFVIQK